jgi:lipopolysaccharide/colanic/teichoic acid biosynthesis glycosyltransferase
MNPVRKNGSFDRSAWSAELLGNPRGFHDEQRFRDELIRERKRAERGSKPILLSLVDVKNLTGCPAGATVHQMQHLVKKMIGSILDVTRDTDIHGWYEQGQVLGVLYTDCTAATRGVAAAKTERSIAATLGEHFPMITIRNYWFPDNDDRSRGLNRAEIQVFYPGTSRTGEKAALFFKRALDIIGSILGLVAFLPVFIIVPILIKLTSAGPVMYRQQRIGMGGKPFTLLKFRTMFVNCDTTIHQQYVRDLIAGNTPADEGQDVTIYKLKNDPRITPIGRLLRKSSFDELPQFFNVLKGDMSLVGPRPPIDYEVEVYQQWHQRRILECKPGLTGLWQVVGRSTTTFNDMVRMDLRYRTRWSLALDLKLIFMTPLTLITVKGAL